jgi:peptidyl-tRNA hydrolase, PTH1 family
MKTNFRKNTKNKVGELEIIIFFRVQWVDMYYIVALGNPGEQYADTRHNVGWKMLSACMRVWNLPSLIIDKKKSGRVTEGEVEGKFVQVLYPETFMNNSGTAVAKLLGNQSTEKLIVVHDDIDLPFGEVRVGKSRGAGGNNGVASIIQKLGTKDFIRVRVGIAPKNARTGEIDRPAGGGPLERFVLQPFTNVEQEQLPILSKTVCNAIEIILREGVERAMNVVNVRDGGV